MPSTMSLRSPLWVVVLILALVSAACSGQTADTDDSAEAPATIAPDAEDPVDEEQPTANPADEDTGEPGSSEATDDDSPESGGSEAANDGRVARIGLIVPTGGTFADIGDDITQAVKLYAQQSNEQFGGLDYELFIEDEGDPDTAVRAAEKLITQDDVDVVIGVVSSAVGVAVRDVFDSREVPVIITNSNVTALSCELASPYVFRTSYSFHQQGFASGRWIAENITTEGLFLEAPDYVGGVDMLKSFREGFEAGGGSPEGIIGEQLPPFQTTNDYQPFLSNMQQAGAEYVWAFHGGGEAINFVQQYADFGLKDSIPLTGWGALADDGILPALGDAALGIRTVATYSSTLDNEVNRQFVDEYVGAYDEVPTYFAEQAYVAAQLFSTAVEKIDGDIDDVEALNEAMTNIGSFDAPRGTFELNPETRNSVAVLHAREVQEVEGELVNVVIGQAGTVEEACPGT